MKTNLLLFLVTITLFTSCQKKIDGSTDEKMKTSIEEIKSSLTEEKRKQFEESMQLIVFQGLDIQSIMKGGAGGDAVNDIKSKIDGKTAVDIIAEGNKIKEEIEKKKKEQAKQEIEELYLKKSQTEKDKIMLSKFQIKRSRFYKRKMGDYSDTEEPIIEMTVLNGTDQAISRAYFTGILSSPGRSVAWLKDDFNYSISGGLEPNEEVNWTLAPNMFSDWGKVKVPKDAIFTVQLTRLDGADGNEIYSLNNFDTDAEERFEELLKSYPEFSK